MVLTEPVIFNVSKIRGNFQTALLYFFFFASLLYFFFFASLVFHRVNALKAYLGPGGVQHVRGVGELSGFCAERDCLL